MYNRTLYPIREARKLESQLAPYALYLFQAVFVWLGCVWPLSLQYASFSPGNSGHLHHHSVHTLYQYPTTYYLLQSMQKNRAIDANYIIVRVLFIYVSLHIHFRLHSLQAHKATAILDISNSTVFALVHNRIASIKSHPLFGRQRHI